MKERSPTILLVKFYVALWLVSFVVFITMRIAGKI